MTPNGFIHQMPQIKVFKDKHSSIKGFAEFKSKHIESYKDSSHQIIGSSIKHKDRTYYFGPKHKNLGFSIRDRIGEIFYDSQKTCMGYERIYHHDPQSNGILYILHHGSHPFDKMLKLQKNKAATLEKTICEAFTSKTAEDHFQKI